MNEELYKELIHEALYYIHLDYDTYLALLDKAYKLRMEDEENE